MRFLATSILSAALACVATVSAEPVAFGPHVVYGIVKHVATVDLVVLRHGGRLENVDIKTARAAGRVGVLYVNRPVALYGDFDRAHRYHVNAITSAYAIRRGAWPADR
jgi:hypothetical protein